MMMRKKFLFFLTGIFVLFFSTYTNANDDMLLDQEMKLKVLSYNVWHGLTPGGVFWFDELEPKGRKQRRQAWQLREIKKLNPDLLILQEVNPLMSLFQTPFYKKMAEDLDMDMIFQVSNCGIKIFSLGVPVNFFSGLMIMAKKSLSLKKIKGLKLSGSFGGCSPWVSFQFKEFRYALFASIQLEGFSKPILVVNTHLHHGREVDQNLKDALRQLVQQGEISLDSYEDLILQLETGVKRRSEEIEVLMSEINKMRSQYSFVIMGGDFNATPDSKEIQSILNEDFFYVFQKNQALDNEGFTWDEEKNPNHKFQKDFNLPVNIQTEDEEVRRKIKNILMSGSFSRRKIDYIFLSHSIGEKNIQAELFGETPKEPYGEEDFLIGSDHFGIVVTIQD